ncbi:ATP-binding protein [Nocardia sp. NPDC052316]|uniref:ATP-binding protein n=1 Tax=Nocardia sp. NPDC052316 TaxID=3364329 RepID=UPI0037CBAAA3
MAGTRLIGREHPAALLREALRRTVSSHGGLVLVSGEAGIGKTTLVTEVVGEFDDREVLVLTATAWSGDGTPGFWPWVQVLRGLRRAATPEQWAAVDDAAGNALSFLIGEAEQPDPAAGSLFRIGDAVTEALVTASALRPVFVVIDDLHRADPASIRVLAFVARHSWFERLAIVGTVRDTDIDAPLRKVFGELLTGARTIELTGLPVDGVAALVGSVTAEHADEAVVRTLHSLSGGNPFLIEQAARLWQAGNPLDTLAPGVRETLDARLAPLPAPAIDILTTAALVGRAFPAAVVAESTGREIAVVQEQLAAAVRARLVTALPGERFTFVHDLVRETLRARIGEAEARKRHAAILTALEQLPREVSGVTPSDLAQHAHDAADAIDDERTLRYLLDAAADACGRLAAGEVAEHYRHALTRIPENQAELRGTVGLGLAAAQSDSGELAAARHTYQALLTTARERSAAELFAKAALGLHVLGMPDPEREARREIEIMDQAHRMLLAERPPTDPLAVQVLAAATRVRVHTGHALRHDAADRASVETLRLARESGDDDALAASLLARHDAIWRPGTAGDRLPLADELARVGRRMRRDELELQGRLLRFAALLELGDPQVHTELAAFRALADRARHPRFRFIALSRTGALAMVSGRFAEARTAIDDAYALAERLGEVDRVPLWLEQRWALALFAGDLAEAEAFVDRYREMAGEYTAIVDVITAARRGELERTRRGVGDLPALYEFYPRHFHPAIVIAQVHAALVLDDPDLRATVRAALAPLAGWWAVVAGGGAVYGPYAYWLGRVAAADGDLDAAAEHLTAAADSAHRMRAQPWVEAARHHLRLISHREPPPARATAPPPDNEFRYDGTVWTLRFAERTVHLPDAKGIRDLHVLLGHPGHDIPSLELFGAPEAGIQHAAQSFGSDPVLDDRAKAEYQRRLGTLDAEIDRAVATGNDARAVELDQERAALLDELRRTAGLAGRTRHLGDDAERARKTVSARVRDSLRRIDRLHPELAEHLRAAVSLGLLCRYQPHREVRWRL